MVRVREDRAPFRRPTNVSIDARLVAEAKELGINVSRASEEGLARELKAERERRWLDENRDAIAEYNEWVRTSELPLAKYRRF
ncbi:type II toxin-antitoxin system CcdA family antitoxin [Sphingomonas sp.]|jgi:antitoxin CcdA|uniref:type II toxin-antitoxin system CcdA family antitoxin n=1 Tax=Sphingomonas sp. TaxID=28214 RepID=UPI002E3618A3|nr:type II toxin-antitoxin system CcdA family antitoxin [Sphingomonas sp.]HEX4693829.1 type II toxin-antitoxin system CcdA family antitoxin [Sphingomonas sp.]